MEHAHQNSSYRRGPVILRGGKIPRETSDTGLLRPQSSADWLHEDPWRVLRIQSEFVEGFGALAELGPAVSVFGSARTPAGSEDWERARSIGSLLVQAGFAELWRLPIKARGKREEPPLAWESSFLTSKE